MSWGAVEKISGGRGLPAMIGRRWPLMLGIWVAVFAGCVAAAVVYAYTRPQLYRVDAQLTIERQTNPPGAMGGAASEPSEDFYREQMALLRSREAAEKLYADFAMETWPMFQRMKDRDRHEAVQSWIQARRIPKSHVVEVWMLWPDRVAGAQIVNRVTEIYLAELTRRRGTGEAQGETTVASVMTAAEAPPEDAFYSPNYGLNLVAGVFGSMALGLMLSLAGGFCADYIGFRGEDVSGGGAAASEVKK